MRSPTPLQPASTIDPPDTAVQPANSVRPSQGLRILVHDYAGHAFPVTLSRALAQRGHDVVHVYASSLQTPRGDLALRSGDPVSLAFREIPMDPDYVRFKYAFVRRRNMEVAYGRKAASFIRAWRPHAVLSGNTPTETQAQLLEATLDSGGRFYYWVQDFYGLAVDRLLRARIPVAGALVGRWYRHLDRRQFERSAGVIVITEDFVPLLTEEFGIARSAIHVVPNWAALDDLPLRPRCNSWSSSQGLNSHFVFLYSGTLGMKHNPRLLLDLARAFADDVAVRVIVVSEGIGADWLRRESKAAGLGNLSVLPYQPVAMLPDVLGSADVLVGILEAEAGVFSVPSKTLSYLCAGRPMLMSVPLDNLAARIVVGADAGPVVSPGDNAGWMAAARQLRNDHSACARFGQQARLYAEQHFAIPPIANAFEAILSGPERLGS